jgi:hypothetical protein
MRDDPNVDSGWTTFNHPLGRKLFKGVRAAVIDNNNES